MASRLELQTLLESLLGSSNVYFQPPPNLQMKYPCIVYSRDSVDLKHAGNRLYQHKQRYQVTVIDQDPDSIIPFRVLAMPLCQFSRFYTADKLNHDVFALFF